MALQIPQITSKQAAALSAIASNLSLKKRVSNASACLLGLDVEDSTNVAE